MITILYWDKRGELGRAAGLGCETPNGWLSTGLASAIRTLPDAWPWDRGVLVCLDWKKNIPFSQALKVHPQNLPDRQ